ncbi:hypothetical protein AWENTII_012156 [Aspergillus wentii]
MGTGIVAVLLNSLPYNGIWLYWISVVIFALNVLLFGIGCIITLLRYVLYPEILPAVVMHPVQSMFLGTFPMGLSTIIDMVCYVCVPAWGEWTRNFAWGLWIFDAVVSVVTTLTPPLLITIRGNEAPLSSFTASWFLPIASSIVASSTGAFVADVVTNPQHALWTIIVSYALWGMGMSLAMMVMVVYFQRLALHKLPPKAVIVSVFLPLGPLGQGAFVYAIYITTQIESLLTRYKNPETRRNSQSNIPRDEHPPPIRWSDLLHYRLPNFPYPLGFRSSLARLRHSLAFTL